MSLKWGMKELRVWASCDIRDWKEDVIRVKRDQTTKTYCQNNFTNLFENALHTSTNKIKLLIIPEVCLFVCLFDCLTCTDKEKTHFEVLAWFSIQKEWSFEKIPLISFLNDSTFIWPLCTWWKTKGNCSSGIHYHITINRQNIQLQYEG